MGDVIITVFDKIKCGIFVVGVDTPFTCNTCNLVTVSTNFDVFSWDLDTMIIG